MKRRGKHRPHRRAISARGRKIPKRTAKNFPIVGVGASAGGYEAFARVLENLPPDTGMAFVLIQHLDPTHESKLTELLARGTSLQVLEVKRPVPIEADHLYVISPNRNLVISDGWLRPSRRQKSEMPPMPIDMFFRSLAEDRKDKAIGVILSGNGSDGTLGLEAIKGADGITFAQAPATAKYTAMPGNAIASGCVDFVLRPVEMATELARLPNSLRNPGAHGAPPRETEPVISKIFTLLRTATGVDYSFYKPTTVKRRISRRMTVHRISELKEYLHYLEGHPEELDKLGADLLITVTRFFRDPSSIQVLRKKVFPALMKGRQRGRPIRVWVPGCSTGEEVYSLAILLTEFLGTRAPEFPLQVFGTDISEQAIAQARAGVYRDNIALDVSAGRLRRFFAPSDDGFRIAKTIRDQCVFARQDLTADPPFSQLDLISCQNVLIYFSQELQQRVLPVFHYALRPNGFLALGSSEGVRALNGMFSLVDQKQKVFIKSTARPRTDTAIKVAPSAGGKRHVSSAAETRDLSLPTVEKMADRILLRHFSPNGVVIDASTQVLQFRGETAPYLKHRPGTADLGLFKLLNDELVLPVRTAVLKAYNKHAPIRKDIVWMKSKRQRRLLRIEAIPFRAPLTRVELLVVLFEDTPLPEMPELKPRRAAARPRDAATEGNLAAEVRRLRQELEHTRESLQAVIEEQEATNEELRSANEESQSSNEELQSTNEELETAKEELQSANEELTTVNDEMQHSNLLANNINNDLVNLLGSIQIPIVMVDNELNVRRFTPGAQRFFSLIATDIGRSLMDIKAKLEVPDLERLIRDVIDNLEMRERQVRDTEGRWFSLRVRPYRTKDNHIDGAVLTLVDVDEFKRGLEQFSDILWEPFLTLTHDLRVVKANEIFYETFQVSSTETEGRFLRELGNGQWDIPRLRTLLEELLPGKGRVTDFSVTHTFPKLGLRRMLLNARELESPPGEQKLILLGIRDITGDGK